MQPGGAACNSKIGVIAPGSGRDDCNPLAFARRMVYKQLQHIPATNKGDLHPRIVCRALFGAILGCVALGVGVSGAQPAAGHGVDNAIRIVELQGTAEFSPADSAAWAPAQTNQVLRPHDWLRTGANSRMALRWSDQSILLFGPLTELEVLPPDSSETESGLHLVTGIISFFHRDKPGHLHVITHAAVAGVEGTEFVMSVTAADLTTLSVIDGKVRFGNEQTALVLTNGQQATAQPGGAPARTPGFIANNVLQWCFYYPAVLDPADLPLTPDEQQVLRESLDAYHEGDLTAALAKYPASAQPGSEAERVYYAALLLSVGQVDPAESALASLSSTGASERLPRLAASLRQLISAVKRQTYNSPAPPALATEYLAASYYEQSRAIRGVSLNTALTLAKQATDASPGFGFAWERVAELEFGFGRTGRAMTALDKSLELSPRNAEALALKGFLLAAQNRTAQGVAWFNRALTADSALGNAWLGRGLSRIRQGDSSGGREDLLVAAALEPQRAGLRSYLGKAYANTGDFPRATKEFQLAQELDTNDPTAWLYSALLNQERSRINDAIGDLEKSEELGDNRRVYRSQFLLDQDQAVRGANLAALYRDAGMFDVSIQEAAQAVNYDYGNYSAHLFLANSYDQLRDPNEINLRFETPEEAEFLVANLLAPPGAGTLSPAISQQEYSRLFECDGFGVASDTEYLSRGAWTESGAQYGNFGNFSYDFEAFYRTDPGQRINNDIEQQQLSLIVKQQITPRDSVFLSVQQYEAWGGDLFQYYDQSQANPAVRTKETQEPTAGLGYHHEWGPGVHTLVYATRLQDTFTLNNPTQPTLVAFIPVPPTLVSVQNLTMNEQYKNELGIYSGEMQQIWEQAAHTTVLGGRIQYGHFRTDNFQDNPSTLPFLFDAPAAQQNVTSLFKRFSFYGYHQWQIFDSLQLIAGLAYDRITFPENIETMPISRDDKTVQGFSPKAGLIWTPTDETTIRFAYTRSISGASIDQSAQLEPSQVAGFVQSYRSIIPESVAGPTPGAMFETFGLSFEQKFRTRTYLSLSGEILKSTVANVVGTFDVLTGLPSAIPSGLNENLDYQEKSLQLTVNQLLGREWSLGAKYRLSQAVLNENFVDVPDGLPFSTLQPRQHLEGNLQHLDLTALYNHPSGFFAEGEALWYAQDNNGYNPGEPGDEFWQFNTFAGYRSPRRRIETTIGLLNITSQNYNLNPLNLYNELPRSRTMVVRLRLTF
jgi:Tfp pilus assembly protein PilF